MLLHANAEDNGLELKLFTDFIIAIICQHYDPDLSMWAEIGAWPVSIFIYMLLILHAHSTCWLESSYVRTLDTLINPKKLLLFSCFSASYWHFMQLYKRNAKSMSILILSDCIRSVTESLTAFYIMFLQFFLVSKCTKI